MDDELVIVHSPGPAREPVVLQPYAGVGLPSVFHNVCRRPKTLGEVGLADRLGEGAKSQRVWARTSVMVNVGIAWASPSPERRALRVRSVRLRVFYAGGRAVDVSVMPRLLLTLYHATHVVVGANTTVDRQPRW